jgi:hypothetical protein
VVVFIIILFMIYNYIDSIFKSILMPEWTTHNTAAIATVSDCFILYLYLTEIKTSEQPSKSNGYNKKSTLDAKTKRFMAFGFWISQKFRINNLKQRSMLLYQYPRNTWLFKFSVSRISKEFYRIVCWKKHDWDRSLIWWKNH